MALHFTKQQIDEIEQALIARSKKDSQFPGADQLEGTELIPIIQNGTNKVTTYAGLWAQVSRELREYVEQALNTKVDKVEGKELSENDFTDTFKDKLEGVEAGAQVNVQSDWTALSGDAFIKNKPDLTIYATRAAVEDIEALIPIQATPTNQLADKNFVNSSIATSTAEFKGTYSTLAELETVSANVNDYGYVVTTDSAGNTVYDRYKYNGENWIFEYSLNNSSFTAAEWASIQSGITAALVQKLETVQAGAQVNVIEGVRVDGTLLPVVNKEVDIQVSGVTGDLRTEDKTDQEFFYRKTADGELNWVPSTACVEKLKGKSIVWNQIININAFPSSSAAGTTLTVVDGIVRINGTATQIYDYVSPGIVKDNFVAGHKYLLRHRGSADIKGAVGANGRYPTFIPNADTILTVNTVAERSLFIEVTNGITYNNAEAYFNIFDLTLMFGAGNEPSTVSEFESMFPLSYYDYNPGTLLSFNGHYLKTVGFNLWDEEWEVGSLSSTDGSKTSSTTQIRSKNYIPVLPNTTYYRKNPYSDNRIGHLNRAAFYDANKQYVGGGSAGGWIAFDENGTFTTPANAAYMLFYVDATTYANDICINLSNASRNGQYEPYKETLVNTNPTELTSSGVQIFPYGLQSAGNVYDEVTETKAIKRVGRVNLGSLTWQIDWGGLNGFISCAPSEMKSVPNALLTDFIQAKYKAANSHYTLEDKTCFHLYTRFFVRDTAYTDTASFKTAMSGVYLNYELATPIVYDLDEPLDLKTVVDINGTEQVYPENTSTPYTTPIRADIQYGLKSSQLLTELRIADSLRFERDFTVTDYSGDHSGESVGFDGSEDATLALPEVINGQVERNTEISRTEEFHYQPVPVKHFNDAYKVDKIYGKTLAWNQLTKTSISNNYYTFTNGSNIVVVDTPATFNDDVYKITSLHTITGHKYYAKLSSNVSEGYFRLYNYQSSLSPINTVSTNSGGVIVTETAGFSVTLGYVGVASGTYSISVILIDLTLMFGAGNEPSTVAEFGSLFHLSYYPYNAGTLISNDAEAIETVGRNQWDEEWLAGYYQQDGTYISANNRICSKNWVPVFPNTTYFLKSPAALTFFFYDADKNFIEGSAVSVPANTEFTTPANARWCLWYCTYADYGNVYNNDICINLSDPAKNGTYEPYRKSTMQLGLDSIRVKSHNIWDEEWEVGDIAFASGQNYVTNAWIRSKGYIPCIPNTIYYIKCQNVETNVFFYDDDFNYLGEATGGLTIHRENNSFQTPNCSYMRFASKTTTYNNDICINVSSSFNGQYEPYGDIAITGGLKGDGTWADILYSNNHLTNKAKRVNLGDLSWSYNSQYSIFYANLPAKNLGQGVCSQYIRSSNTSASGIEDKSFNFSPGFIIQEVNVRDSAYNDAATFKAAMDGVYLDYELATPIEYELAEPMLDSGWIDENGTMRVVYEDESAPHVQFKSDITYGINAGHIIDKANEIIKSFKEKLETLWDAVFNNS